MLSQLRPALTLFLLLTLLTGVVYPAAVTLVGQAAFPHQANGSVLKKGNTIIGSELIGQSFKGPRYFWGRPSKTDKFEYNAELSTGSNLGPTNPDFLKEVEQRIKDLREAHPDEKDVVPIELVTASGSGLDPHISPAAAEYQMRRVAKERGLSLQRVRRLVADHTEPRTLGLLGEARVHVLQLNLALDELQQSKKAGSP